jgi:hypothetical protein
MEVRASFLSLCAHSLVWWLLTNALGTAGIFLMHLSQAEGYDAAGQTLDGALLIGLLIAIYTSPAGCLAGLVSLWAMAAAKGWQRAIWLLLSLTMGYLILLLAPSLLTGRVMWPKTSVLKLTLPYPIAAYLSAFWLYRPWIWYHKAS